MENRREHPRLEVHLVVDYQALDAFFSNRVMNLSRGGLFIRTEQPLPLRSEVDLNLSLPDPVGRLQARGRVAWNYDIKKGSSRIVPGMGIKIIEMAPEDRLALARYLETLQSEDG